MSRYYSCTGDTNTTEGQERLLQRGISVVFFLAFTMLITVMLFNLLIAMMGSTYEQVKEQASQRYSSLLRGKEETEIIDYKLRLYTHYCVSLHMYPLISSLLSSSLSSNYFSHLLSSRILLPGGHWSELVSSLPSKATWRKTSSTKTKTGTSY